MISRPALVLILGLLLGAEATPRVHAQQRSAPVYVDDQGVIRWTESDAEVALFGVNYSTPFAFGYRAHEYVGADRKASIDADVAHLARLGLDAFRIHVWDREISDRAGNLLENDHLDLLDYLLAKLQERGIKAILTPIAWWPPGYPEPAPETQGFSEFYGKGEMSVDLEARAAQVNYLKQFIAHTNPYNDRTYRDDPDIIAVELFNEPSHPGGPEETTRFINALATALREAGFTRPIFYNISQGYSDEHGQAVCAADIQGVSVQWYPTGLVRNSTIRGNMLPNVDRYTIPFGDFPDCQNKARMVYEFDAADVYGSYIYPAMARSFRGAGFQWATQFAYDPLAIAYSNTEYQTHFLNLVYAPAKTLSFMIAGEVFRTVPRGMDHGTYPATERFGPFRVSYAEDLSEMVTDTAFFYLNDTPTTPPDVASLRHVAGGGSSPVVTYDGTGAYFLDRAADGVWRLEVYPDAIAVEDPFSRPSLDRHAVRLAFRERSMEVSLPDLGDAFSVEPLDEGNSHRPTVRDGGFAVRPGVYLLTRSGAGGLMQAEAAFGERLREYYVPEPADAPPTVVHAPPAAIAVGAPYVVQADVYSAAPVDSVLLLAGRSGGPGRTRRLTMTAGDGFSYDATLPDNLLESGLVNYRIVVFQGDDTRTFPGGAAGHPLEWDFTGTDAWTVPVVANDVPLVLFDARRDADNLLVAAPWSYVPFSSEIVGGTLPERSALRAVVRDLTRATQHLGIRSSLPESQRTRLASAPENAILQVRARATDAGTQSMEVGLVERDGVVWGTTIPLGETWQDVEVPLSALERMPLVLLPRPYPHFLPYTLMADVNAVSPDVSDLDGLQFGLGAGQVDDPAQPHGFEIERVMLITP